MNEAEIIRELANRGRVPGSVICTVKSVDTDNYTCDLTPVDGAADIIGARLTAKKSVHNTVTMFPRIGSFVIATMITRTDAFVAMADELETFDIKPHGKIDIRNDAVVLKDILNDLILELKNAIIQTPSGAGNFSPTTTAKLDVIDNQINQLFKDGS